MGYLGVLGGGGFTAGWLLIVFLLWVCTLNWFELYGFWVVLLDFVVAGLARLVVGFEITFDLGLRGLLWFEVATGCFTGNFVFYFS